MDTKGIYADTIDEAAEQILWLLREDPETARGISSRNNVFYFDGWDGLGASAVLRAIARRLTATSKPAASAGRSSTVPDGSAFEQVMHIDCSMWQSRRALQRAVAEQLGLPAQVMDMFDKKDEEDDFRGVPQGSRLELQQVVGEMYQHIQKLNRNFLVIFQNGNNEEIDFFSNCGLPLSGYSTNKVLWTFQGRFRLKSRAEVDSALKSTTTTHVFISASTRRTHIREIWYNLVREEAEELVAAQHKVNTMPRSSIDQPALVEECLLYMLELCCRGHQSINYDFTTHGANYWVCDGIIENRQQKEREIDDIDADDDDGLWRIADALWREMKLDVEYHLCWPSYHVARFIESKPVWVSPTYGFSRQIPVRRGDMFQHYLDKLRVLKLSGCTFNLQSAPFYCCHDIIRFLWLDRCQVDEISTTGGAGTENDDILHRCFQRLWVLDIRYTAGCNQILSARMMDLMTHLRELNVMGAKGWDIGQLRGHLPNIRKLRVQNSTITRCSCSEKELFSEMNKMELLEFSNITITGPFMRSLYGPRVGNNSNCLETIKVSTCSELHKISFRGCSNLKNILLSGWLYDLRTLDISGTAVKTLDLAETVIHSLDELYLLYCEKLCAINWPPKDKRGEDKPVKLHISTTQSSAQPARCGEQEESSSPGTSSSYIPVLHGNHLVSEFDWYISVRDARLLVSLVPVFFYSREIYVEISSTDVATGVSEHERIAERGRMSLVPVLSAQQGEKQPAGALIYADVTVENQQQGDDESNGDAPGTMCVWPCPDAPHLPKKSCYMHIQDQRGAITVPQFVTDCARILHVKDNLSITILPSAGWGPKWDNLEWCRIERCPKLEYLFGTNLGSPLAMRCHWRIFWASLLTKARYIWEKDSPMSYSFEYLTYLHLDFCPRVTHALPSDASFNCLVTLDIMWCGALREVFPRCGGDQSYTGGHFPQLKHIHLHELPTLHSICGPGTMMSAPELEIVKIRGCWSLKRLPTVQKKAVQCDCEKEWWDSLQWEGASQKELYKPIHPRHYKKATLLRGSVLR